MLRAVGWLGRELLAGRVESFCLGEEVGGVSVERGGDFEDVREAGVALSPLDAADVGAVEVAAVGEGFLGEAGFFAGLADGVAECGAEAVGAIVCGVASGSGVHGHATGGA